MAKILMLFKLQDRGVEWQIIKTIKEKEDYVFDPSEYYEIDKENIYLFVRNLVKSDQDVRFPKGAILDSEDDFTITPFNELKVNKSIKSSKGKMIMEQHFDYTIIFDFIQIMINNNALNARGHFITNDNYEEKYTEIIASGVTEDIQALEIFIETYRKIEAHMRRWDVFSTFKKDIDKAPNIETIEEVYQNYALLFV